MAERNFMTLNPTPRDAEYVEAYKRFGNQREAAEYCGVSRETVARAVRRAGIRLTGRKNNGYHGGETCGGDPLKVTNDELRLEVENGLTVFEIAKRHGMSYERCYRRAKSLGLPVKWELAGDRYKGRADFYEVEYDSSVTLDAVMHQGGGRCQICGRQLDKTDKGLQPTIDHIIPMSKGGAHVWSNVHLACLSCNARKKDSVRKEAL